MSQHAPTIGVVITSAVAAAVAMTIVGVGIAASIGVRVGVADGVGFSAGVCFAAGVAAAAGFGVAAMAPPALWRAGRRVEGPDQDDGGESMRMRPCSDTQPRAQSGKPHNVEGKRYWRWPPCTAKGRATNRL